ncbi:hypothetical protein [Mesorhizobium australicum]|uniref:Uncharacterized protein n=1 Tax=Mesorhizobium australicum TaxID=536018 RepID=A0A1X7NW99_9HYPH|nr:hypothetical protein [Mesorhizobium australicum]SMH42473.1 hypothetical protein SAMN02982922_2745 [Mesorhizobium australicum]
MKLMGLCLALASGILAVSLAVAAPSLAMGNRMVITSSALEPAQLFSLDVTFVLGAIAAVAVVVLVKVGVPVRIAFRTGRRWVSRCLGRVSDLFIPRPLPSPS